MPGKSARFEPHQKPYDRPYSVMLLSVWLLMLSVASIAAQDLTPQRGLHYFVIENLDTRQIVQRGTTGSAGIAFNNLILAPNTRYRAVILQAETLAIGSLTFTTPSSGRRLDLPRIVLGRSIAPDSDGDGLDDDGEFVMGTSPAEPDSDSDGVRDGAEVQQGTDPLEGTPVRTGIIGTTSLPGTAVDVCAFNDMVAVAGLEQGVSIFNAFNRMSPIIIAQIDTPGTAQAVACARDQVVVADGVAGLAVIGMREPPEARIVHQIATPAPAQASAVSGSIAYVGLTSGRLLSVDLRDGTIIDQVTLSAAVQDVAITGDFLYALVEGTLYVLPLFPAPLGVIGSVASPGAVNTTNGRMRLFVGGGIAYATHARGFNTIDVSDPTQPALIAADNTAQFGWKQIVANGSGLGVAAVSPNQAFDGPHDISLYDLRDAAQTNNFVTTFETPGVARAVALYNGLAYVAAHLHGLQILNYLAYDALGVPPTLTLTANFSLDPAAAEEGQVVRVTARVSDDVQVRNVAFFLDGIQVATDGNFPFEYSFVTPLLQQQPAFTLQARASDTGGNSTTTEEITVTLTQDATPPQVIQVTPSDGAILGSVDTLTVLFSEPIDPATLSGDTLQLFTAGADDAPGTADDVAITTGVVSYRAELNAALLTVSSPLPAALYRAVLSPPLADRAGNSLATAFVWTFRVFSQEDRDHDGVPDELETLLGLAPNNPDTDGNGILDGDEDFDGDGLSNAGEILLGTDPTIADTDGNDIPDGDEDTDQDGLADGAEIRRGTNPFQADTDQDGWPDGAEVEVDSDPRNANSRPGQLVIADPLIRVFVPSTVPADPDDPEAQGRVAANVVFAQPVVTVVVPSTSDPDNPEAVQTNVVFAQPDVTVIVPSTVPGNPDDAASVAANVVFAQPGVTVVIPATSNSDNQAAAQPNVVFAQPDVTVVVPSTVPGDPGDSASVTANVVFAQPDVTVVIPTINLMDADPEGTTPNVVVAQPPLAVISPFAGEEVLAGLPANVVVAQPFVTVEFAQ